MSTLTLKRHNLIKLLGADSSPSLTSTGKPRLRSEDLFRAGCELIIEHRGEEYRLKITRNDKLILNK